MTEALKSKWRKDLIRDNLREMILDDQRLQELEEKANRIAEGAN